MGAAEDLLAGLLGDVLDNEDASCASDPPHEKGDSD
jgi:hypothetical protein